MGTRTLCIFLCGAVCSISVGQPQEWSDDFQSVQTYDYTSLTAPCSSGPAPKYTVFEVVVGDMFNEHAVSGGGCASRTLRSGASTANAGISSGQGRRRLR